MSKTRAGRVTARLFFMYTSPTGSISVPAVVVTWWNVVFIVFNCFVNKKLFRVCNVLKKLIKYKMSPGKPNPAKMLLRNEVSARIAALTAEEKKRQSEVIFKKVISHPWYKSSNRIALYMSTEQEVDTLPLIDHVKARGAAAFVPQYAGGHMKMLKVHCGDQENMELTKHGIAQHGKDAVREDALETGGLDLIVAPGLAFSKSGLRLGHGGGYYDKYLAKVRQRSVSTKVIALAFDCQVVPEVPVDENDQRIDEIISVE